MSDNSTINLAQFMALTGASSDKAAFYLESHKGDLQEALAAYFESEGPEAADSSSGAAAGSSSSDSGPNSQPAAGGSSAGNSKMKTLRDLMSGAEDDDDDEHQNYFAGGEKSGVLMQGGPKEKKKNPDDIINDILSKAAKGAPQDNKPSGPKYFGGSGYKLGNEAESSFVPVPQASSSNEPEEPEIVERSLTFWRDGFSIEDGPLYRYDDPANEQILAAINSGRGPTSLFNVRPNQQVDVRVAYRKEENYVPPPKKPFAGTGNRLGGYVSDAPQAAPTMIGAFPSGSSSSAGTAPAPVAPLLAVDASQPVTSVQVRLADGTRLVAKMNHTHTIADLRNFINHSRPGGSSVPFMLQTTFPNRDLTDESLTLKEAGLLNAVVVQRRV